MAVLSSDPTKNLLDEVKKFDLENIFDEIISNVHDKEEEIHELILRNKVGKAAGIKTIAITWGFSTEEKLKLTKPDYLVHNIEELEKVLL